MTLLFCSLSDWFITKECIDMWYDDYDNDGDHCDDGGDYWDDDKNKFFEWYDGYRKPKARKTSIKEELLPIAWHTLRYWDWCMSEDEKRETEKLWT